MEWLTAGFRHVDGLDNIGIDGESSGALVFFLSQDKLHGTDGPGNADAAQAGEFALPATVQVVAGLIADGEGRVGRHDPGLYGEEQKVSIDAQKGDLQAWFFGNRVYMSFTCSRYGHHVQ